MNYKVNHRIALEERPEPWDQIIIGSQDSLVLRFCILVRQDTFLFIPGCNLQLKCNSSGLLNFKERVSDLLKTS